MKNTVSNSILLVKNSHFIIYKNVECIESMHQDKKMLYFYSLFLTFIFAFACDCLKYNQFSHIFTESDVFYSPSPTPSKLNGMFRMTVQQCSILASNHNVTSQCMRARTEHFCKITHQTHLFQTKNSSSVLPPTKPQKHRTSSLKKASPTTFNTFHQKNRTLLKITLKSP